MAVRQCQGRKYALIIVSHGSPRHAPEDLVAQATTLLVASVLEHSCVLHSMLAQRIAVRRAASIVSQDILALSLVHRRIPTSA